VYGHAELAGQAESTKRRPGRPRAAALRVLANERVADVSDEEMVARTRCGFAPCPDDRVTVELAPVTRVDDAAPDGEEQRYAKPSAAGVFRGLPGLTAPRGVAPAGVVEGWAAVRAVACAPLTFAEVSRTGRRELAFASTAS